MIIQAGLVAALLIVFFLCGQTADWYLLQIPVAVLMFRVLRLVLAYDELPFRHKQGLQESSADAFRPRCSGCRVSFDVYSMAPAIEAILMFNPVTFFVTMYRCAVYDKMWIWEKPEAIIGFVVVFILQLIATTIIYKRTHEEVADVL